MRLPSIIILSPCLLLCLEVTAPAQTLLHEWKGPAQGSRMGAAVTGIGDLDGDGCDDVLVGAPNFAFGSGTQVAQGYVGLYSGSTGKRLYRLVGKGSNPYIGGAVAAGGDFDGDGIPDLLYGGSSSAYSAASVSVYSGAEIELLYKYKGNYLTTPEFGNSVLGGVDLDLDGFDDFLASAPQPFGPGHGRVTVWSGATGLELYRLDGQPGMSDFGVGLASLADLDGDGAPELLVGTTWPGQVDVHSGADGSLLYSLTGTGRFGRAVANLGDVDGDSFDDFVAGAYEASGDEGRAYIFSGIDGALLLELHGSHPGGRFGFVVAGPGDLDGDGVPDVVVGAPFDDELFEKSGRVTLFSGADGTVLRVLYGREKGAALGTSVGRVGDVNAGGVPDLLAGAPYTSPYYITERGQALVWSGERSPGTYCEAAESSLGCTPTIWSTGTASLAKSTLRLSAHSLLNEQPGELYWGLRPAHLPFRGGTHCVGEVQGRRAVWSGGNALATFPQPDCSGTFRDDWSKADLKAYGLVAGQTIYAQFRYADPGAPEGFGLTDAVSFDILP